MYIDIPKRSLEEWSNHLTETQMIILQEYEDWGPDVELTPGEILEILIEWYGGLSTAFQVKQLISQIYGVEL